MDGRPGETLRSVCSRANRLIVAAPYIKNNALTKVVAEVRPETSVVCITRWSPHDIAMGVSDTECRTFVVQRGGSFRLHPSLHAKYYRADDTVLVGSANLTNSALGWSSQANLEILCTPGDDFDADTFQRRLFEESREISDEEFSHWESITDLGVQIMRRATGDVPRLDTWRPATRDPTHLEVAYRADYDQIASLDEQRSAQRDIQALRVPPGLTNQQVRAWISGCLLAASFTNTVLRLRNAEAPDILRSLAEFYKLSATDARRDMETVETWLSFFAPATLTRIRTAPGLPEPD